MVFVRTKAPGRLMVTAMNRNSSKRLAAAWPDPLSPHRTKYDFRIREGAVVVVQLRGFFEVAGEGSLFECDMAFAE